MFVHMPHHITGLAHLKAQIKAGGFTINIRWAMHRTSCSQSDSADAKVLPDAPDQAATRGQLGACCQ